ncbi:MAG TPA: exodeoxyribonuclease III [Rikenellaceae bacterium]|nr:exodeoxyribonuclease III [Rikenellaceae bacterium]HBH20939.1 exodeoxyribonuclease III [Rikenellaceae bacterium]
MKFISWNVNGLRAVAGKGFADIFKEFNADFVCLQETKLQSGQIDMEFPGYNSWWNYADKKGYSGTAIYSRQTPISIRYGLGAEPHDHEGRVITFESETFYLVNVYTPNSQDSLKRLDYRMSWEDVFREYVCSLGKVKPVIICGDMNVAHNEIDLKNPATNHLNPGFSDEERGKMTRLLDAGFCDTWRYQHPQEAKYSWWSYRMRARERNVGWRIDYFLVSDSLKASILSTDILNDVFGSDHCPVELVLSE